MIDQLSWKVGGQQGEGIESTGELFATVMARMGYHLYGYRHFSSRIKGGHTSNKIRVSTKERAAISDHLDVLLAFDQETIDVDTKDLRPGGIILADAKFEPKLPEGLDARLFAIPFSDIATELGNSLMKNMVAVGATSVVLGLSLDPFNEIIREMFTRKGEEVVAKNIEALSRGAQYLHDATDNDFSQFKLNPADGKKRLFMIGNDAIALGAIAAGCRFMPAYPITPASEIMEYLIKRLPQFGGAVIQTEDEMAAVTMAIGAGYGGIRAMTASAGPGLSLMMEAIGLSGMTETPIVIVNTQRGGPSTGLPTKQEQSDIMAMIYGTHGEIPKVVLAPSSAEEAFYMTTEAFNIAEELQVPVILLSDLSLSLGKMTTEPFDINKVEIRRGKYMGDQELPETDGLYKRYELTEDGISPRSIPGQKYGLHAVTGVEHNEVGRPSEAPDVRKKMMDKRMKKLESINFTNKVYEDAPYEDADLLIIGVGSTKGTILEAKEQLVAEGYKVNQAHIHLLHPFPKAEVEALMKRAKHVAVVENNATGQIAQLIQMNVGMADKLHRVVKYNGTPFLPGEVYNECKGLM
ncbi:2-oxoacid:acceptor oxidoreductase subunit alpha [Rubeoparvulum massiliense]|uniref:2-oxoacid:acceptor oxidoreductase subunit alpha n=1 Tax=Rubeoparvulum massiliense TaxID=1631346 RepID=UPI00065E7F86|nr:2-oxoacid:acceptor oxidoreductase subunit alpha [Rubeoparvulum massiliense]